MERVRALAGPATPRADAAERELRRAIVEAKLDALRREQSRLLALVAKGGSPPAEDLTREQLTLQRRRQDLERRREELRRLMRRICEMGASHRVRNPQARPGNRRSPPR